MGELIIPKERQKLVIKTKTLKSGKQVKIICKRRTTE